MAFPLCGGNVRRQGEPALPTNTPEEPKKAATPVLELGLQTKKSQGERHG